MRTLFLISCFFSFYSFGQTNEFILFFKDKKSISNTELSTHFSSKSLLTKSKTGFDFYDLPVTETYKTQLNRKGKIINSSKWLNAVHYSSSLNAFEIQEQFLFVNSVLVLNPKPKTSSFLLQTESSSSLSDTSTYKNSYIQLETTQTISCLHNKGFDGSGVLIAVIDAGFPKMDSMKAFKKMRQEGRIIDTWDFEDNTSYVYHKSNHGTYVSSIIGAGLDSLFIGSAPKADYAFYITEITRFERNIEEFNLILGLERADSIGADICSISLGYREFDSTQLSYSYSDMDGKTTIASQGVSIAKNKGIIISVAAGNSGSGAGTLSSPCDVDSILCVGAIQYDSIRAGFSSEGPTSDGRIKPDVVDIGAGCFFVNLDDSVRHGNGTSFATPLFSGMVACLKQAHPLRTNFEIIEQIKNNSNQANSPDNIYGWGIPNGCKIDSALFILDQNSTLKQISKPTLEFYVYPNPASSEINVVTKDLISEIYFVSLDGKLLKKESIQFSKTVYKINISNLEKGMYLIQIKSKDGRFTSKKILLN